MATHVRLEESVYDEIDSRRHEDETFSEAIDRLISDWSLVEWAERYPRSEKEAEAHRELLEEVEETGRERLRELGTYGDDDS